jgi:hypothetical protein
MRHPGASFESLNSGLSNFRDQLPGAEAGGGYCCSQVCDASRPSGKDRGRGG